MPCCSIRKSWADLSGKLASEFNLDSCVKGQDDDVLRQAKALYDSLVKPAKDSKALRILFLTLH